MAVDIGATVVADGPAADAVRAHAGRTGGRAVRYLGVERLVGTRRVDEILGHSAIEQILVLGLPDRTEPPGDALLQTRSYVRPQWTDGRLTLFAMPTPDGHIAPFEVSNPTPCCADH